VKTTLHPFFTLAIGLAILLVTACSPVRVNQEYAPSADFTTIHSYGWRTAAPPVSADPRIKNPLLHQRFRDAIEQTLNQRGYRQEAEPDVLVSYSHTIISRPDSDQLDAGSGLAFGRSSAFGGFSGGTPTIRQYDTSVLTIDIYDASGERLLWRGTGSAILTTYDSPSELTVAVNRMVTAILAQFPPPATP
jgi:hypothetical protein